MEYTEKFYKLIIENMINAFAYHKIITNENNKPIDYVFIDVNTAFENMTGLKRNTIIEKRVTEVIPGIRNSEFDWIGYYGNAALNCTNGYFEQYSEDLGKWFAVAVFSYEKGYFVTIFNDITELKLKEQALIKSNADISSLYEEISASEEELRQQLDELKDYSDYLKTSEDRLNRAQALAHVGNWELDLRNRTMWASEEAFKLYGIPRESQILPLKRAQSVVHIDDRPAMDNALKSLIERNEKYDVEFRIFRESDNTLRYMHSLAALEYDENNMPKKVLGVIQDMTESKEAELKLKENHEELSSLYEELTSLYEELTASDEELREQFNELQLHKESLRISEEKYRILVENSDDMIFSCDIDGNFTAVNKKFSEVLGLEPTDIIGKKISELNRPDKVVEVSNHAINQVISSEKTLNVITEFKTSGENMVHYSVTLSPIFNSKMQIIGISGIVHDITEIKRKEQIIQRLAYYDSLTDLPNRVLFTDRLNVAINRSKRNSNKIAVIFLDLDNFKKINDTMGHFWGDELLKQVGKELKTFVREYETLARFSGDEFAILLENIIKIEDVISFTDRIKKILERPFSINGITHYISASMGISIFPNDGHSVEELIKNADIAMYKVKDSGKNDYRFFSEHMKEEISRKLDIEKSLRIALENNEFFLCYQPQVEIKTGSIRGYEALIRWNRPNIGVVSPLDFIPIAEETGLIVPIGMWVLRTACKNNKMCQAFCSSETIVSVNISAVQLKCNDFVEMVKNVLDETGLEPEYLELEITESVLIDSFDNIVSKLEELRALGIKVSLDDFGTGYSSLNYLRHLPLNTLKIDKAFVEDIKPDTSEKSIAGSIISLVHKLDLEIIAEGVETKEQLEYLKQCNCDGAQGYFLHRPMTELEILRSFYGKE